MEEQLKNHIIMKNALMNWKNSTVIITLMNTGNITTIMNITKMPIAIIIMILMNIILILIVEVVLVTIIMKFLGNVGFLLLECL
ncbi:Uncharacterised protein [Chlamydia trachomatis]|nr:Uncharacterised protein [Chlamydia trachomatis]